MNRFTLCLFALSMIAGTARVAGAEPNHDATSNMVWALGSCRSGLQAREHSDYKLSQFRAYKKYRDASFAADPSIKKWNGRVDVFAVQEWLQKCEPAMTAALADASAQDKEAAKQSAIEGFRACIYALEARDCKGKIIAAPDMVQIQGDMYREKLKTALDAAPDLGDETVSVPFDLNFNSDCAKDKYKGTRTVKVDEERAHCDAELPKRMVKAKADEKTEVARDAAEDKKIRAQAKGDRARLLASKGFPNYWGTGDADDVAILKAGWWRYYDNDCEVTISFRGNKVGSTQQSPERCFSWR